MAVILPFSRRVLPDQGSQNHHCEIISFPSAQERREAELRIARAAIWVGKFCDILTPTRFSRLQRHFDDINRLFDTDGPEAA